MTAPVAGGGVDVLAVLARHEALAVEVASPEQVAEAQAVYAAVAELIAAAKELRERQRAYLADPKDQRDEAKGRAVGIAAARLDAALSNIEGGKA